MRKIKKYIFLVYLVICLSASALNKVFAQITVDGSKQATATAEMTSATGILKASMKALAGLSAVEYEIQMNEECSFFSSKLPKVRATTKLVVTSSPLRAVAKLEGDDGKVYENFVLNDKIMRYSAAGKIGESDILKGFKPLVAYGDFNNTWQLLLDRDYFAKAIADGRILYAGQDSIEDDLCDVIVHVTSNPSKNIIATNYYWISTKTRLPRAKQTLLSSDGQTTLNPRRVLKITKMNPAPAASVFAYTPTEKDSVPPSSPAPAATESNAKPTVDVSDRALHELNGKQLPDITVENASRQKIKISGIIDKPTLVTFWATWCVPCRKEMPFFQKMADKYKDKLQVLAVATSDNRSTSEEFIEKHPEYKFVFLFDLDGQRESSVLKTTLSIDALPTNLLVDSNGKIVSDWRGERDETEWAKLIDKLIDK